MSQDIPRFPDIPIDSIKRTMVREIEVNEINSEERFLELLDLLWRQEHVITYLIRPREGTSNDFILGAEHAGVIKLGTTEMHWYVHPKYPGNYVRIRGEPKWDWEREVLKTQPMLMRTEISLTDRERRRRDLAEAMQSMKPPAPTSAWQKIKRHYDENRFLYWLFGIGLSGGGLALKLLGVI